MPVTGVSAAAAAKSLQFCPTLCDPIDGSPPGSRVPLILQAGTQDRAGGSCFHRSPTADHHQEATLPTEAWAAEGRPGQVHMCTGDHPT